MDNAVEVVALLRQQAALEHQLMNTAGPAVAVEWALAAARRRLVAYPEALAAVLHTARALRRSPTRSRSGMSPTLVDRTDAASSDANRISTLFV
jgi:hypothetical protein